jgi:hypothetical protein
LKEMAGSSQIKSGHDEEMHEAGQGIPQLVAVRSKRGSSSFVSNHGMRSP